MTSQPIAKNQLQNIDDDGENNQLILPQSQHQTEAKLAQEMSQDESGGSLVGGIEDTAGKHEEFPWDLGIFDAHCHPTDTMSSIAEIPQMKTRTLTVMATREDDQDLVFEAARSENGGGDSGCRILPCFGWHPWFSYQIYDDSIAPAASISEETKKVHYEKVLVPSPKGKPDGDRFITALPSPKPLSQLLAETRARLLASPASRPDTKGIPSLVGEIGLDRVFRLPNAWTPEEIENRNASMTPGSREGRALSPYRVHLDHQKTVLRAQLQLAGELQRPVSLHSVQAHGAVFDLLKELWRGYERKVPTRRERRRRFSAAGAHEESDAEDNERQKDENKEEEKKVVLPFPPRVCMHSYSGPVDPVKQFLHQSNPSDVYFSFSSVINFSGPSAQKVVDVIKVLPDDRILIESDLHTAGPVMDQLLEDIARQVCEVRGWGLVDGVKQLGENWKRFVNG